MKIYTMSLSREKVSQKRRLLIFVVPIVFICLLSSYIPFTTIQMTSIERGETQVVGTVTASWTVSNFLHIHPIRKTSKQGCFRITGRGKTTEL
jgi:preprotein translocase subunit SecY